MDTPRSPEYRQRRLRKRWALTLAAPLTLGIAAVLVSSLKPAAPSVSRSSVILATVKEGPLTIAVEGSGVLAPRLEQWITAASPGVVKTCFVRPGDATEPNTVLVELQNPVLAQRIEQARSDAIAGSARLASLQAQLKAAMLDLENQLIQDRSEYKVVHFRQLAQAQIVTEHIIAQLEYDETVAEAQQLRQRVLSDSERIKLFKASLRAQLHAARVELAQLKINLAAREEDFDNLKVRAEMRGIVQQVAVQDGQRLDVGGNIARIAQQNSLIAELQVAESQAGAITLGQAVQLDVFGAAVNHFAGTVTRVDPEVHNGTVEVDVLPVGRVPEGLRIGLDVEGNVVLSQLPRTVYVERPAGTQAGGTLTLFRIQRDGRTAVRTNVRVGRVSAAAIQVLQGLTPGDEVIVSDTSQWSDDPRIELTAR